MNIDRLSLRLETVASYMIKGMRLADIGSDHAYLPCYCVRKGISPSAIAGEVADGPLKAAKHQVAAAGLAEFIDVRKGDGLEVLQPSETDCVVIAGMGGALISDILERGKDKLREVERLILQPNVGAIHVRKWLMNNGRRLSAEEILEEDGKIYEILVADFGDPLSTYGDLNAGLLLGPYLMEEKSHEFRRKWEQEVKQWENIVNGLEKAAKSDENLAKKQELLNKIVMVKEALE